MRRRDSVFWKLAVLLVLFCLMLVAVSVDFARHLNGGSTRLPESTKQVLSEYALQAQQAHMVGGARGVDVFLQQLRAQENVWAAVLDRDLRSLSSSPLSKADHRRLRLLRGLGNAVGRPGGHPTFYIPFGDAGERLVMELPARLNPRVDRMLWDVLTHRLVPAVLALLLGVFLYRSLISPLVVLQRQAQALSQGDLSARTGVGMVARADELGELARAFDRMAERLESMVGLQRRLLSDLSHELRTPLSRLRVAGESAQALEPLRQRLDREVQTMERLISDTLELAWLDTERPVPERESIDVARLWDVLRENVCFESGWNPAQLPCDLPANCCVLGHLNGLAQALENIVRNAVRHSPAGGVVRLWGRREGDDWQLWIDDQGGGIEEGLLESIFEPFRRLNAARPGEDGYGLGLAIARSVLTAQGGSVWAQNIAGGLRMCVQLPSV